MWSCVMSGLPTHLVQELNIGTVAKGAALIAEWLEY